MSVETRFAATMVLPDEARAFGWQIVLAVLAVCVPLVMLAQGETPSVGITIVCILAAIVLGAHAVRSRRAGTHEVRLEQRGERSTLVVTGPSLALSIDAPMTTRALRGEIAIASGHGTIAMPVHVLVIEKDGSPVLLLEEPVGAIATHDGWRAADDGELDHGDTPVLRKGLLPIHLERLRDALR